MFGLTVSLAESLRDFGTCQGDFVKLIVVPNMHFYLSIISDFSLKNEKRGIFE